MIRTKVMRQAVVLDATVLGIILNYDLVRGLGFDSLKPYSFWFIVGGIVLFATITFFDHEHHNYSDCPSLSSIPKYEPLVLEKVLELVKVEGEGLTALKCPTCSAPLSFNSSHVTTCGYCNTEVQRS